MAVQMRNPGKQKLASGRLFIQISEPRCLLSAVVNDQQEPNLTWCEELYQANARQLILYGRALGLSHGEAEDILQETFRSLIQRETAPQQPAHYCVRTFRNKAFNYKRSLWRRVMREVESARWFERSEGETPLERAAMRRLAELPVEQREVIVLKIWHQYTFEEIGGLLELSPNTAAGRYRYGMLKLKTFLEGNDYEQLETAGGAITFLDTAQPLARS
jgi:RNA polymerase sigma-70 factor (ECF subfamily)